MMRSDTPSSITYSIQDYLKCIYDLTVDGDAASTNAIAHRLGVSAASVTGMVQKMAAAHPPLLSYRKHQGVRLSVNGRREALRVIRSHRLLETWLVESLGYSWDDVHGEAERLEHAVSPDLERRISRALGNPERDPHGEPIPTSALNMPRDTSISLDRLHIGQTAMVRRVHFLDPGALQQLERLGILIGSRLRVVERSNIDRLMTLRVGGHRDRITLGPPLTGQIFVEPVPIDFRSKRR
jgi:DtxR family transcriptional regulator, Mn-dependent transcriptional regulator